ncbi:hypothetical protein FRC09_010995 [Ceratobasidium sp. 395]|nr:hypothetical protein FRC09_010995 [Ceratobasidium sp. 395]
MIIRQLMSCLPRVFSVRLCADTVAGRVFLHSTNFKDTSGSRNSYSTTPTDGLEDLEPDETDETEGFQDKHSDASTKPRYMSRGKLLAAHRARTIPELRDEDLDETFVRGSGPGGQAINKTSSSVSLIHRPTGIRVQCQATRSREDNRRIARKILLEKACTICYNVMFRDSKRFRFKLDQVANPGLSKLQVQQEKEKERKRQRAKKARKKTKAQANREASINSNEAEVGSVDSARKEWIERITVNYL